MTRSRERLDECASSLSRNAIKLVRMYSVRQGCNARKPCQSQGQRSPNKLNDLPVGYKATPASNTRTACVLTAYGISGGVVLCELRD